MQKRQWNGEGGGLAADEGVQQQGSRRKPARGKKLIVGGRLVGAGAQKGAGRTATFAQGLATGTSTLASVMCRRPSRLLGSGPLSKRPAVWRLVRESPRRTASQQL